MTVTAILKNGQEIKAKHGKWEKPITVPSDLHEELHKAMQMNKQKAA